MWSLKPGNNKWIKQFNGSYARACYHHKKRIRKKNYARARRMMGFPMPYAVGFKINNPKFRKIYKALKLCWNK